MTNSQEARHLEQEVRSRLVSAGFHLAGLEALADRDWWGVFARATTERYWECFDILDSLMWDDEYARAVRELWVACNGLPPDEARRRLLQHGRNITTSMWMRDDDAATYESLPDTVTVYRGCQDPSTEAWSWTLDRATAEHFARGL